MVFTKSQKKLAQKIDIDATKSNWKNWKWQLKHKIVSIDMLEKVLNIKFSENLRKQIEKTIEKFPMSITPYYLSLVDIDNIENDPIFKQAVPSICELEYSKADMVDPLHEDKDSPISCITHRYPDRVLFLVSNTCSVYCRHCTRKRKVGDNDNIPRKEKIKKGIEYIKNNPQIRDVLLSGGDPFLLSTDYLDWILTELKKIKHIEIIRIGTRIPVVLPYRVTDELVNMLKKHHPIWINTHFNHPREITASSKEAIVKLANAGIPLGNQSVLLAGINDCPKIMKSLVHKLVANRIRPYYLYQCDLSEGLSHFRTPVGKGIEIIESLIGHTTGFCVPTYVIDAPGGGGKIPVMPNYLISWSTNKVILRNYEGVITTYTEPNSYKQNCDGECNKCNLQLPLDEGNENKAIGIEKLLADYNETISLIPEKTERVESRKNAQ